MFHEKNTYGAIECQKKKNAWVSKADEDEGWPRGVEKTPPKGALETNRLSWLSLRVLQKGTFIKRPGKTPLLFSIPKKVVPLAVKRNRLKRLIREAVRQEAFFKGSEDRVYWFRVFKAPQVLDLNGVKQTIKGLLEGPVG